MLVTFERSFLKLKDNTNLFKINYVWRKMIWISLIIYWKEMLNRINCHNLIIILHKKIQKINF